jgi:DNA/RNA-binding domain of Phe-tRNA-synthetase-like protein
LERSGLKLLNIMHPSIKRRGRKMKTGVEWSPDVTKRFPELKICIGEIDSLCNEKTNEYIQRLSDTVLSEVRAKHSIETLKDDPRVRAYRDFYWKLDIDPTKTRPSGEALLRRVLHGDELPRISTVVDAYNLASTKTIIPISGFDTARLKPPFQIRFATNEVIMGIGKNRPMSLADGTLVLADEQRVLCIYPYRDSDHSKITLQTHNALIIAYGAPGITENQLVRAVETALSYIVQTSRGEIKMARTFSAGSDDIS